MPLSSGVQLLLSHWSLAHQGQMLHSVILLLLAMPQVLLAVCYLTPF